jgi:membrane protein
MNTSRSFATSFRQSARSVFELLFQTYENWRADRAIRLGAALAYYGVFALIPLLSSAVAIAGLVFSQTEIEAFISDSLAALLTDVSPEVQSLAETFTDLIERPATSGSLATLSVLVGIFAASLLFVALQDSFNMIWKIPVEHGFRDSMRRRFTAFLVVLLTGAALLASIVVQTIALLVDEILAGNLEAFDNLIVNVSSWGVGVAALGVLFQLMLRDHLAWRNVYIAATLVGVAVVVGTWAAGFYFDHWGSASITGVFGGVLIFLTWLYYLAQILIAGVELLKTMEDRLRAQAEAGASPANSGS